MISNFFHHTPQAWQDWARQTCFKGNDRVVINAYRKGPTWAFSMPPWTFDESLFVEDIVDELIPADQDRIKIVASTKRFAGAHKMWWLKADEYSNGANIYMWHDVEVWICKFSQFVFGREESDPPQNIFFTVV